MGSGVDLMVVGGECQASLGYDQGNRCTSHSLLVASGATFCLGMTEVRDDLQSLVGGNQRFPTSRTDAAACEPVCNLEGSHQDTISRSPKG